MSSWSCQQCTLVNSNANSLCAACGAERSRSSSLLPRLVIKPISDVANAILDALSGPSASVSRQLNRFMQGSSPIRPSSSYPDLPGYFIAPNPSFNGYNIPANSHDDSLSWVCRKCSKTNSEFLTYCEYCNERKAIGSKRRLRGLDRNGPSTSNDSSIPGSSSKMAAGDDMSTLCSEVMTEVERQDCENASSAYNNIISMCRQFNTTFIDDSFPHTPKSIGDLYTDVEGAVVGRVPKTFIWLRPVQMYTKDGRAWPWTVFRDPRSSDIEQGCLGDCWLLSAMALIAERPDVLEHILLTKEYSHFGVYQVRLCIDGQWKIVLVDDFFPCRVESKSIAFADGRKNQLWVPLIEKALAKQLGSYARLLAGRTIEGLSTLTGAPVEMICLEDETDKDVRWARILSAREAGFIMGCSCGAGKRYVNPKAYEKNGLLARHAYSILDVVQEGEHRLLRLRNPWGSFVWNGKWSNKWSGWPKELKQKLLSGEPSTGTFWISYDDFLAHFDAIDIAKIRWYQGWRELRIPLQVGGDFIESDKAVRILIEEPTEVCFTLFQIGARKAQEQVDILVCLHKVSPASTIGELVYRSPRKLENFVSTGDVFLRPGHYIVVCHSFSTLGSKKIQCNLAIHSSKPIYADMLPCPAAMFTDSLVQMVLKEGKIHKSLMGVFPRYVTEDFSGLLLMVDNVLEDMWVHARVECSNSTNLLSSRGALDVADSIPPLSRQIIIILTHFEPTQSYSVEHQLLIRVSRSPALGDFTISRGGFRVSTDSHSPSFGCPAIEQLHSRKALFYP
uniref:Calpain catalytic domain-containing protein n=1 Tax=Haemonchus contortus TaxID=6289 RepID=A0A7I4YYB2_HAECO